MRRSVALTTIFVKHGSRLFSAKFAKSMGDGFPQAAAGGLLVRPPKQRACDGSAGDLLLRLVPGRMPDFLAKL
jgi:hypothetical protein